MLRIVRDGAAFSGTSTSLSPLAAMTLANFEGRVDDALAAVEALSRTLPESFCPWASVAAMIDTLIMTGRYRDALALPDAWSEPARALGRQRDCAGFVYACVNAAEALYNLGRLDEAAELVARARRDMGSDEEPLAALGLQQAWIATLRGAPEQALSLLVDLPALPKAYRAELSYTRAAALSALGRHAEAAREARRGLSRSLRVSSFRNGYFLCGAIAHAAGESARAVPLLEAAAEHPYKAQSGAGLLCLGDALVRLGRVQAARAAYLAVSERDPESHTCAAASGRLEGLGARI